MKTNFKHIFPAALLLTMGMVSCTKDLDVTPIDPNYAEPSANMTSASSSTAPASASRNKTIALILKTMNSLCPTRMAIL